MLLARFLLPLCYFCVHLPCCYLQITRLSYHFWLLPYLFLTSTLLTEGFQEFAWDLYVSVWHFLLLLQSCLWFPLLHSSPKFVAALVICSPWQLGVLVSCLCCGWPSAHLHNRFRFVVLLLLSIPVMKSVSCQAFLYVFGFNRQVFTYQFVQCYN